MPFVLSKNSHATQCLPMFTVFTQCLPMFTNVYSVYQMVTSTKEVTIVTEKP